MRASATRQQRLAEGSARNTAPLRPEVGSGGGGGGGALRSPSARTSVSEEPITHSADGSATNPLLLRERAADAAAAAQADRHRRPCQSKLFAAAAVGGNLGSFSRHLGDVAAAPWSSVSLGRSSAGEALASPPRRESKLLAALHGGSASLNSGSFGTSRTLGSGGGTDGSGNPLLRSPLGIFM